MKSIQMNSILSNGKIYIYRNYETTHNNMKHDKKIFI